MTINIGNVANSIKILSMETDDFFRVFLHDSLLVFGKKNVSFTFTSNVKETIEVLNKNLPDRPDVIFLCLSCSLRNDSNIEMFAGFEALKILRKDKNFKDVPIIIFSKYKENFLRNRAKKLGANKFLVKGECMPKDIADAIASVKVLGDTGPVPITKEKKNFFQNIFRWK